MHVRALDHLLTGLYLLSSDPVPNGNRYPALHQLVKIQPLGLGHAAAATPPAAN